MILPVRNINNSINFSADKTNEKELVYSHDTLLNNNIKTRVKIGTDKLVNAFTLYPAKGLKGSKNANFYEFLTMGTVPYLTGSLTLMALFNYADKHYSPFQRVMSKSTGNKLALGVLFYGLMKNISKSFISTPVKIFSGVDIEQPYAKVIYELPDDVNDTDIMSIEHHKVFESVEFPRWDLLYDDKNNSNRNIKYDRIAKKMGLGDNLNDSDQDVKPMVKKLVVKSSLAKNISSYLWAAVGVGLAVQDSWDNFFKVMTFDIRKSDKFIKTIKSFGVNFKNSTISLWKGSGTGVKKQAGKLLVGAAVLSTLTGVLNSVLGSKRTEPKKISEVINKNDRYITE